MNKKLGLFDRFFFCLSEAIDLFSVAESSHPSSIFTRETHHKARKKILWFINAIVSEQLYTFVGFEALNTEGRGLSSHLLPLAIFQQLLRETLFLLC